METEYQYRNTLRYEFYVLWYSKITINENNQCISQYSQ